MHNLTGVDGVTSDRTSMEDKKVVELCSWSYVHGEAIL